MTALEAGRLEDFKRVLTYRLVTKIKHDFNGDFRRYYAAPAVWTKWRTGKIGYSKAVYQLIIKFNSTSLSRRQVRSIFGRNPETGKWLPCAGLIASDPDIKVFNKGTICMRGERYHIRKRYQLPFEFVKRIFDDEGLLAKVADAESDYYTDRQRRLIFTQINNVKRNYHYKTKAEKLERMSMEELVAGIDL